MHAIAPAMQAYAVDTADRNLPITDGQVSQEPSRPPPVSRAPTRDTGAWRAQSDAAISPTTRARTLIAPPGR
jgi:hypothetical protein